MDGFAPYDPEDAGRYKQSGWWLGLTWGDLFDKAAGLHPGKVAVIDDSGERTYAELRNEAARLGTGLLKLGIARGDFVLLQLPNWKEFVCAFYALTKIGAIPVLLIPRHARLEIDHFCQLTGARAWIVPERYGSVDYLPIIEDVVKANHSLRSIIVARKSGSHAYVGLDELISGSEPTEEDLRAVAAMRPGPEDAALILPTGGTTGLPKAVVRTHNSHLCNLEYTTKAWELASRDRVLVISPVGHNLGLLVGLGGAVFSLGTLVLMDSTDPKDICEVVQRNKVTAIATLPPIVSRLLRFADLEKYDLSSLKKLYLGGQPLTLDLVRTITQRIGCSVVNAFGSSEGLMVQTRLTDDFETVCNTVGTVCCPYDRMKIIDPRTQKELGPNEEGELVSKGPGIFAGYYRSDDQKVFTADGFFRHGDLGRVDESGILVLTGRIKDIIRRGGENISAHEIETLLVQHPSIVDAAAVGMPDPVLGEKACAYVQTTPGASVTFQELIAFMQSRGASKMLLPERIEFVAEIPYTKLSKEADKKFLREDIKRRLGLC